ncbi:MAG TPA: hypothetical protein VEA69_24515 [Tepidisphaeraceae bacterium]|nr:hypothetical protein [Tepidisphaeraceae bacterium]
MPEGEPPHHWSTFPLRLAQSPDPPGVAGAALRTRQPLSRATPPGLYKFVVDAAGHLWVGVDVETAIQHTSLVPPGQPVRAAGNILITADGTTHANARSGHYITESPFTPAEEPAFLDAIRAEITAAGLTPGQLFGGDQPLVTLLPHRRRRGT